MQGLGGIRTSGPLIMNCYATNCPTIQTSLTMLTSLIAYMETIIMLTLMSTCLSLESENKNKTKGNTQNEINKIKIYKGMKLIRILKNI